MELVALKDSVLAFCHNPSCGLRNFPSGGIDVPPVLMGELRTTTRPIVARAERMNGMKRIVQLTVDSLSAVALAKAD